MYINNFDKKEKTYSTNAFRLYLVNHNVHSGKLEVYFYAAKINKKPSFIKEGCTSIKVIRRAAILISGNYLMVARGAPFPPQITFMLVNIFNIFTKYPCF